MRRSDIPGRIGRSSNRHKHFKMKHLNFISSVRTFVTRIVQDLFPQSRAERTSMVQSPLDLGISYFKAWNNQNLAGIIASFTKGGTYSDPVVGKRISRKATAEYAKILWEGSHELKFEVT